MADLVLDRICCEIVRGQTEHLERLPESEEVRVEVHELPVCFCAFLPHFVCERRRTGRVEMKGEDRTDIL